MPQLRQLCLHQPGSPLAGNQRRQPEDKVIKNRQLKGSKIPAAKLTETQIETIKKLLVEGKLTYKQISEQFGVHLSAIGRINEGSSWYHVEGVGDRKIRATVFGSKLNQDTVIQIKKQPTQGVRYAEIAALFGISRHTVGDIACGRTWKEVT